jgi:hypothetical protein
VTASIAPESGRYYLGGLEAWRLAGLFPKMRQWRASMTDLVFLKHELRLMEMTGLTIGHAGGKIHRKVQESI